MRPSRLARTGAPVALALALAAPATAGAVPVIDPYRYDVTGGSCSGGVRPGATSLLRWLTNHDAVGESGGIYACRPIAGSNTLSLHGEGRAVDWVLDNRQPRQRKIADGLVAAWLKRRHGHDHALARRMGIQEVIWNCRIWRSERPADGLVAYRPCATSADRTTRHENHVHIGLSRDGAERRTGFWARGPWAQDLVAVRRTEAHRSRAELLDGGTGYRSVLGREPASFRSASDGAQILYGDYDHDRVDDLFVVRSAGPSRWPRVLVFSGADRFTSRLLVADSPLTAGSVMRFAFGLGDHDHDGRLDLYAVKYSGARSTEVRVLDGADGYTSFLRSTPTPLPRSSGSTYQFAVGDHDNDGRDDIYAIRHRGGSQTTVHVLDGATNFTSYQAKITTPLRRTDRTRFLVGDGNDDGFDDLYAISGSERRAVQVISLAGPAFRSVRSRTSTSLRTTSASRWAFALPAQPGL